MAVIEIRNVSIQFPGVKALDNVTFEIEKGQAMALCGENGAGKSTLAKIIAGVYPHGRFDGKIIYCGEELINRTTLDAEKRGIAIVHQELNLISDMTVAENIFLGKIPNKKGIVDYRVLFQKASEFLKKVGLDIDPKTKLRDLTVSRMQMVEIAKAIARNPEVLIFDEATSSLTNNEISVLFDIIRRLKKSGITMIYVSHKLNEIFEICDTVTVLKDGCFVRTAKVDEITKADIIRWMVGRDLKDMYPARTDKMANTETLFKVENWNVYDPENNKKKVIDNVSFSVNKGELLGIYGLVGAGRTELVNSLFEGKAIKSTGKLWMESQQLTIKNTTDSISYSISMATEDRKKTGLVLPMSVKHNISLASMRGMCKKYLRPFSVIEKMQEKSEVLKMVEALNVKVPNIQCCVAQLSGGNQQKVVLAKWLLTRPKLLILDEPTRGIDVGAKSEIYKILRQLSNQGMAIIMISSELPEIIGVSDRVLVMREGRITYEKPGCEADEETLVKYAMGGV